LEEDRAGDVDDPKMIRAPYKFLTAESRAKNRLLCDGGQNDLENKDDRILQLVRRLVGT
jgi:hypothetical protein